MDVLNMAADTLALDSQTNATASAALAAPGAGFKWRVVAWGASFSGTFSANPVRATISNIGSGGGIGAGVGFNSPWHVSLAHPLDAPSNTGVTLALPAGGASTVGDVWIAAFKVPTLPAYVGP